MIWIALAIAVLLVTLYFFDGKSNSDVDVVLAYGMLILSFPVGLLIALIGGALGSVAFSAYGYVVPVSYVTIVIAWLVFLIGGYVQWFVFLPFLLRKMRKRRSASTSDTRSN